ncbi:hypothetical protein G9C85_07845 [Halorubellus sp. JP-L1]|uniref:DUF5812 family protein n=1 Tax=Halorubellus sp. JP-L1 TaxID=2715753 RepID=UPI00140DDDA4|nr:DUF5812 family protein [Halorubellus sp. JP-L1]NHN41549.1 hypothetical protein [Halorubellus sp. JP-L1]
MTETTATFLVTEADADSAVLRDVDAGQVYTLADNDAEFEAGTIIGATVAPVPPMDVVYEVVETDYVHRVDVVDTDLSPTTQAMEVAADLDVGEVERIEREGTGELHVLSVPPAETEQAARDVLEDEETIARAGRVGAVRVEVRRDPDAGVLNVRYLPD